MEILLVLLAVVVAWLLWDHNQKQKAKASAAVAESVKEEVPYKVESPKVEEIAAVAQVNSVVGESTLAAVAVAESKAEAKPAKAKKPAAMKAKKPAAPKATAAKKAPAKKPKAKKTA